MSLNFNNHHDRSKLKITLGPLLIAALEDPHVNEIMLNPDGKIFADFALSGMQCIGKMNEENALTLIKASASLMNIEIIRDRPIVSGELFYDGSRFEALLPPLVKAPIFSIRKHNSLNLSLDELKNKGFMSSYYLEILKKAVLEHKTILISGQTGCGKTTLINALLNHIKNINKNERVITLEDTRELALNLENSVSLVTNENTSLCDLVKQTLRLRPDRIVIGEVRGPEALDLLDALCTGHKGALASIHAGSIEQTLKRLALLITRHPNAPKSCEQLIAEALDVVVLLSNYPKRHIKNIAFIKGYENNHYLYEIKGDLS